MEKFVTFFPSYQDFHFYKDPGQIPFRFKRKGYDAKIVTFESGFSYPDTERYIEIETIPLQRHGYTQLSVWHYMKLNARDIDVFNVFHISFGSLFAAFAYKFFNKKGFVYLKMDNCSATGRYEWEEIWIGGSSLGLLKRLLFKHLFIFKVDLFSVEDQQSLDYYSSKYAFFKNKLVLALNGHTVDLIGGNVEFDFNGKENIVLTVGRLGTYQKATDNLLAAFVMSASEHDWKLILAGEIAAEFKPAIEQFYTTYPELRERVIFLGPLEKLELFDWYRRAKIFCLPSRFEGFANVYSEAMYYGCAIVTTAKTSVGGLIEKFHLGVLVRVDDAIDLSQKVGELITNSTLNQQCGENAKTFCNTSLSWDHIADEINDTIEKMKH